MDELQKKLDVPEADVDSGFGGLSFQSSFSRSNSSNYDFSQPDTEVRGNSFASSLSQGLHRLTIDENSTELPSPESLRNDRKRELFLRAYTPDSDGDM